MDRRFYERCAPSPGVYPGAPTASGRTFLRIVIGSDHAGYAMKQHLAAHLAASGHTVIDLGTHGPDPVDYPDFAAAVARAVVDGRAERGVMICGSGAGAGVAANKIRGARAALAHDTYTAHQSVEHDDVNVLCLGSRVIGEKLAEELVDTYVAARFSGEERHLRRLEKVRALEEDDRGGGAEPHPAL